MAKKMVLVHGILVAMSFTFAAAANSATVYEECITAAPPGPFSGPNPTHQCRFYWNSIGGGLAITGMHKAWITPLNPVTATGDIGTWGGQTNYLGLIGDHWWVIQTVCISGASGGSAKLTGQGTGYRAALPTFPITYEIDQVVSDDVSGFLSNTC